jgi:hypothetical protein
MNAAMERELARLESATDMQLLDALMLIEDDPAPQYIKDLILRKINSIMNDRLGIAAHLKD